MSDVMYPGGPVMVKIDGSKVRQIREQKGLTQLYIATAVDVTTDTVSRWENKRYPSIKKENGLRLAQALEVSLEEILETAAEEPSGESSSFQPAGEDKTAETTSSVKPDFPRQASSSVSFKTAMLLSLMLVPLFGISMYFLFFQEKLVLPQITAVRTVSPHFIAGQPFPVFIHISNPVAQSVSFILRENLPPGTMILSTDPEISDKHKKNKSIQWLGSIVTPTLFLYVISTPENFVGTVSFDGILIIGSADASEISVSGDNSSTSGLHHWADKDRDNRISDEEILTIYDLAEPGRYSNIDMDQLEEIWLGDGYIWQPDKQQFSILE